MDPRAAFLEAFDRHLRRRRLAVGLEGARRGGRRALAAALALLLLTALGVLPPPGEPLTAALLFAGFLLLGSLLGAGRSLLEEGGARSLERALDGVLGGTDLVATAVALAGRPGAGGRFGAAVLDRATGEVGALPPERVGPLPRPPWALLGIALLAAVLLALLPKGGLGLLPGLGVGWGRGGRAAPGGLHAGPAKEHPAGDPRGGGGEPRPGVEPPPAEGDAAPPPPPPAPPPEPPPPPPKPPEVARLSLSPLARVYPSAGPVTLGAVLEGGPGAAGGVEVDLAFAVDGGDAVPVRAPLRIAAGGRAVRAPDLRSLPGLSKALTPGKHRVRGEARDGQGRTVATSEEVAIEIEGGDSPDPDPKPKPDPDPKPDPKPDPEPETPPPPPPPPPAAAPPPGRNPGGTPPGVEPEEEPAPPPSSFERKRIQPLFGEGEEILKRGPVLVLDPEGGRGDPAREAPPAEVLAEVRARAESAARREGMDPADRDTIRLYFEALRRRIEGGGR